MLEAGEFAVQQRHDPSGIKGCIGLLHNHGHRHLAPLLIRLPDHRRFQNERAIGQQAFNLGWVNVFAA